MTIHHPTASAIVSFIASLISMFVCATIAISIRDKVKKKNSYHLKLVLYLLLSDIGVAFNVAIFFIVEWTVTKSFLQDFCKVYMGTLNFFLLLSFEWTILFALRFLERFNSDRNVESAPFPLKYLLIIPLLTSSIVITSSWLLDDVSTMREVDASIEKDCTFDYEHKHGVMIDIVTFQIPLVLTICINVYAYVKGLLALDRAPFSVVARQMRKAGGYLLVIIMVWVPNIIYNILSIFDGSNESYAPLVDYIVLMIALQGFMNVCVYIWSNPLMRKWLIKNLICFKSRKPSYLDSKPSSTGSEDEESAVTFESIYANNMPFQNSDASTVSLLSRNDAIINKSSSNSKRKNKCSNDTYTEILNSDSEARSANASVDLDTEKYVRFGPNSTRVISDSHSNSLADYSFTSNLEESLIDFNVYE